MLKKCANPKCAKTLHYLREGRVFVFESKVDCGDSTVHRVEHYWLCGDCSRTLRLERTLSGIRTVPKRGFPRGVEAVPFHQPLAS